MKKKYTANDNRSMQLNPNNPAYNKPQKNYEPTQADKNNRAEQLNPNNDKFEKSRGF